jgi:hypothetical protein
MDFLVVSQLDVITTHSNSSGVPADRGDIDSMDPRGPTHIRPTLKGRLDRRVPVESGPMRSLMRSLVPSSLRT